MNIVDCLLSHDLLKRGLFSLFPPPPKFLKITFLENKNIRLLIISKTFHSRKLTSIRVIFRLNKTLFTHFDYDYVRFKCLLMTQNWKLLILHQKCVTTF